MNKKSAISKSLIDASKKPLVLFMLGVFTTLLIISILPSLTNAVSSVTNIPIENTTIRVTEQPTSEERPAPQDYLRESQIKVYKDRIIIDAQNVKWASFEDTNSMLPILDSNSNALQIEPICPAQIDVGDIVSYKSEYAEGIIIHRVVYKDEDESGVYFILKGDNNPTSDPGKVRCSQIQRRVIGILY
jgi:hypothetical protein